MKTITKYDILDIQSNIQAFWDEIKIDELLKNLNDGKQEFYFLDGPPYTTGQVHLGTAWNKSLKDAVLRFKRMQGFKVINRAGYDMHGLPIEHATEKELGIKGAEQIKEFGVEKFIDACRKLSTEKMKSMNDVFKSLAVSMDFENAYQPISKEFIEGQWWFLKLAYEKGRLYEGLRTTMWDAHDGSAVAKHETEYKEVEDTAIFVKFKIVDKDEYLVIWTTTPWTIPFNSAIMANPEIEYSKVAVDFPGGKREHWWGYFGEDSVLDAKLKQLKKDEIIANYFEVEKVKGVQLENTKYEHFFANEMSFPESEKLHSVVLSKEYVDTSSGSGLVHCAPGCGPEDFEVGYRNGIAPYNTLDENGVYQNSGKFDGLVAKQDDAKFVQAIEEANALVHKHSYVHDYPYAERSKKPVVFRTTKQWFLKVDDIKEELLKENNEIGWVPKAGYNAFNSWLENLRDNSISKQRFWGTPIPIWKHSDDDFIVIGSAKELEELSGVKVDDLHKPSVDPIVITKDGKEYKRIPDVLDVWVDSGTTLWNSLQRKDDQGNFIYTPADFITEGKDQIRGWFNLLHVCSLIVFGKKAFKNCYMHGFINDSKGRKMSKSLGNYITPDEVTSTHGTDTFRFYAIGASNPGLDLNYNLEDVELRSRNLVVLWNIHKFILDMKKNNDFTKDDYVAGKQNFGVEEQYLLSKVHATLKTFTEKVNGYNINELPYLVESLFLDISRTYIQLIRDKASSGTTQEKQAVYAALCDAINIVIKMFAPIAPLITEQMYFHLKELDLGLFSEQSIHLTTLPVADESLIDNHLMDNIARAGQLITAGLAAREIAKYGVRWPLANVTYEVSEDYQTTAKELADLIKTQLNVKDIKLETIPVKYEIKPNFRVLGKAFGTETGNVVNFINSNTEPIIKELESGKKEFTLDSYEFTDEMFVLTTLPLEGSATTLFDQGKASVDTNLTDELKAEGFMREITRQIQSLRKQASLNRTDLVNVYLEGDSDLIKQMMQFKDALVSKVGAKDLILHKEAKEMTEATIKGQKFLVGIEQL